MLYVTDSETCKPAHLPGKVSVITTQAVSYAAAMQQQLKLFKSTTMQRHFKKSSRLLTKSQNIRLTSYFVVLYNTTKDANYKKKKNLP